jgi:hypothetical protein
MVTKIILYILYLYRRWVTCHVEVCRLMVTKIILYILYYIGGGLPATWRCVG